MEMVADPAQALSMEEKLPPDRACPKCNARPTKLCKNRSKNSAAGEGYGLQAVQKHSEISADSAAEGDLSGLSLSF
jgi:hypothetical protein